MNLRSWFNNVAGVVNTAPVVTDLSERFFRQICRNDLSLATIMKSLSVRAISVAVCLAWALLLWVPTIVSAQTNYYSANGTEYSIAGPQLGDQVYPDLAVSTTGGMVVWQDNATDGDGWGIRAEQLDATLSGSLSPFRVNATGAGDQENAKVALLKNGGTAFVWQGGVEGFQHIFARFLNPANTFLTTTDVLVSVFTNRTSFQVNPAITVLANSNVVVVWSSFNQAGANSLQDVYAKILSPLGATVKSEFLVNQFTNYNQRTPAVAALKAGGFVVAWVSEQQRSVVSGNINETNGTLHTAIKSPSVDIYARMYLSNGVAASSEFLVNAAASPSANPSLAAGSDGGFLVAWSGRDLATVANGWDVYGRTYTSAGAAGTVVRFNTYVYGNQYAPHLSAIGSDYLAIWTSMSQDGSREGVYGQLVHGNGALVDGEFRVNTSTMGQQMQPAIASDGATQFVVVWTSFVGTPYNFDLFGQRYMNVASVLQPMSAPFVWVPFVVSNGTYQPQLVVSWSPLLGLSVSNYEVYVDGNSAPTSVVTSNLWMMTAANNLAVSSTHSFQVDYVTTDGRRSPISPSTSGTTWGGHSYFGIPIEWAANYYSTNWPADVNAPLAPGGLSLYQVFLSGGNPLDPSTWLKQQLVRSAQGTFLTWNTVPGATYQLQTTTNLKTWSNWGSPRFAAGTNDSVNVGSGGDGYYRVNLLR